MSAIVEAEPVDQTAIGDEPEDARHWVARLRLRRHGAGFGKAAAHREHGIGHARIFVEACGDPDRVWKIETENNLAQNGIVGGKRAWVDAQFERFQSSLVRVFGFQREERRSR